MSKLGPGPYEGEFSGGETEQNEMPTMKKFSVLLHFVIVWFNKP